MKRFDFAGKTVLVTGASMGIGAEFARELSRRGATLILVARSEAKLAALAAELGKAHVIAADLAAPRAAQCLFDAVAAEGLDVDVLVNNAGFGVYGSFGDLPLQGQREQIDLNVGALVELTHLFLPMIERRRGGVIQVASLAGFQPCPYFAVYGATKAFVLSFSEALWAEYKPRGVRILALCPGATETPFFERAGLMPLAPASAAPSVRPGRRPNAFLMQGAAILRLSCCAGAYGARRGLGIRQARQRQLANGREVLSDMPGRPNPQRLPRDSGASTSVPLTERQHDRAP